MNKFIKSNTLNLPYLCRAALLISSTLLAGCSTISHFFIANDSESLLEVIYGPPTGFHDINGERLNTCFEDRLGSAYSPSVVSLSKSKRSPQEWSDLAPEEYVCDFEDYSVSFLLESGFAAVIAHVANYTEQPRYPGNYDLGIRFLTLKGNQETLTYEGESIVDVFHEGKESALSSRYVLRYE